MPRTLKIIRQNKGLSLKQLAQMSGVGASTIGNWENDKTEMSASSLKMLADALGLSESEISSSVRFSDPRKPEPEALPRDGSGSGEEVAALKTDITRLEAKLDRLLTHLGLDPTTLNQDHP